MEQRLSLVGLMVGDMTRARHFYEQGLGFMPAHAMDDICFYRMNGFVLGLSTKSAWEQEELQGPRPGPGALSICCRTKDEVEMVLTRAPKVGGKLLKPAHDTYWGGYSGYFADPDGNYWEVAFNPYWEITREGYTVIPPPKT
ncbi:MAG: VOC family protein [Alphaproteobacteria bacterium]